MTPEGAIHPLPDRLHPWDLSPAEARAVQRRLAQSLILENRLGDVKRASPIPGGWASPPISG